MIDEQTLTEWERVAEAATEGPWYFQDSSDTRGSKGEFRQEGPFGGFMLVAAYVSRNDTELMALSRSVLPQLIHSYRELQAIAKAADHCYGFGDMVRITGGEGVGKIGYLLNPWDSDSTYWHIYHDETVCSSWHEHQFELVEPFDPSALVAVCVEWYTTGEETQTQRDANLLAALSKVMSEAVMPVPEPEVDQKDFVRQRLMEIVERHRRGGDRPEPMCWECSTRIPDEIHPVPFPCDAYSAAHVGLAALDGD